VEELVVGSADEVLSMLEVLEASVEDEISEDEVMVRISEVEVLGASVLEEISEDEVEVVSIVVVEVAETSVVPEISEEVVDVVKISDEVLVAELAIEEEEEPQLGSLNS
jgi:hypothetical protein